MPTRYIQTLRILIQFCYLAFTLWLGFQLFQFVRFIRSGGQIGFGSHPAGVEAFLPISGLLGTISWLHDGSINVIHPAAVVIFVTILAGALLLRRSFCSWICPVATISECSWKLGFKLFQRTLHAPGWLDIPLRAVKYLLLFFFIYSMAWAMPPEALKAFINSDYHKLADIRLLNFFLQISPLALTIVLTLTLLSLLLRNPFCRYLCPYGALLGLLATISPLRVTRDTGRCVSCGVCSQVCPTSIDVMHKKSVLSPECIGCWRCISHCGTRQALSMKVAGRFAVSGIVFAILVIVLLWGGSLLGKLSGNWHTSIDVGEYRRLLVK
ncbi:MAG TPA: 4Fe-4S binding protein [Desulfuromonadales bacterium]|nr:4Fe-4S binding protein [Desulfuromonadales bacterium]